jgi:hypothetical protein
MSKLLRVGGIGFGRVAVTPADLEAFSGHLAKGAPDVWKAGGTIGLALNAPHRLPLNW